MTARSDEASPGRGRFAVVLASAVLFLLACVLPAMTVFNTGRSARSQMFGLQLLLTGWLGPLVGQFAWYANPFHVLALVLLGRRRFRPALWVGLFVCGLGLTSLHWPDDTVYANEAGVTFYNLIRPHVGFYCWMASLVLIPASAFVWSRQEAAARAASPGSPPGGPP
jgi:hypothetical protein